MRHGTRLLLEDEDERGVRAQWMKNRFLRLTDHASSRLASMESILYRVVQCVFMIMRSSRTDW